MAESLPLRTQHFINNEFVDSVDGQTFKTFNPADEKELATVQRASPADVDKAVVAARDAFKDKWETSPGSQRRDMLNKLADLIEKHADRLAEVESLDNGKPQAVAKGADVALTVQHYRYFAGWADKCMAGKTIPTSIMAPDHFAMTLHEPIGVVGCIIPWNFPLLMQAWKLAPLLACGCTCVMKTSEKTPLTGLMICQLIKEAGFPPGVVNVLSGYGADAGEAIARHKGIDKVCFTGSSAVGHKVIEMSAQSNMKRVTLELGGKSPLIICDDADLDQAIEVADFGLFFNAGQCCCASSRLLIQDTIYDQFVAKCVEKAKAKKLTSPTDPKCSQGPQVDKIQFDKIMSYIESGKKEGAKLECGGGRHGKEGYFIKPTVFSGVKDDMKIAKEEIFGPVMQCMKFKTINEAIERANNTNYGLAAGVCSRDIGKAMGIAKRLKAGSVWINCWDQFDDATPFGGYKTSGWGREKSEYALENFTEVKCVQFPFEKPAVASPSPAPAVPEPAPVEPLPLQTKHFINNEFVDSIDGQTFKTFNPADETELATVQRASQADVDKAVVAARKAFKNKWETSPGAKRRDLLNKLADLIEKHADRLAEVESLDNGKPQAVAKGADVALTVQHYRYFAGWADKGMCGKTIPTSIMDPNHFAMTVHEPIGVVGCIIPWNFPLLMQAWKLAPLLACGCTCVMKTSEKTPLTGLMICQLIKEAGFPPGVVNVLSGYGADAGEAIARHADIDKVCFTGSSAVGHKIIEMSAQSNMKRVTLELGGKSPFIICDDADLDVAVKAADFGLFFNAGQCCCASSRLLIQDTIYDKFVAKCVEHAKSKKLTDPKDGKCDQGPQVDKIQFDKIMAYIESGKKEGAKLECGGGRHGDKGYFIQPTVFGNVTDEMKIAKEEIFGPVMQCMKFKTIDEAIERANNTDYGLAAGVCSQNIGKAVGISKRLKAGTVWINCWDQFDDATPFGGYKTSGWGREKSAYALENFTEVKCIQFPVNDNKKPKGKGKKADNKKSSTATKKGSTATKKVYDYSGLEAGMRLQVQADNVWYAADVLQVSWSKNRSKAPVKVSYKGYEGYDEWVGGDRIRSKALKWE